MRGAGDRSSGEGVPEISGVDKARNRDSQTSSYGLSSH